MSTKKIILIVFVLAVAGALYWGISPLFNNIVVDEALPEGAEQMMKEEVVEKGETEMEEVEQSVPVSTPEPVVAEVVGTVGHPASGTVRLVEADGKTYVRYENYKTINGPDIFVYLAKDLDAKEFVNLGRVRATEGNINYEVPADVDTSEYHYVLTWCKAFGVLFNSADFGQ